MEEVTIKIFSNQSGYTEKAIRNKIAQGVWEENVHYYRAPDSRIFIKIKAVCDWIKGL